MDPVTERLRALLSPVIAAAGTATVARLGLGLMLVLAGVHKLLAPAAWAVYVTDWLAPWLVVHPRLFMLANGPPEILVGALLLADRYVAPATAVAAVSLPVTVLYLAVVAATDGRFVDVLIRDVGLAALAWVVLLDALGAE
ncbi:DoxX family membrane protein [Halolamina salina]|uniref:DoxX family membrane protein n=1 Tax=Halolamina salina TaxID=1220023 RepID=A0ABD6B5N0_9EURY